MAWRVAASLEVLRKQLNEAAPGRSKASDGAIGDVLHATRDSDHNPWIVLSGVGIVTARDFTHDPAGGLDCHQLAAALVASGDPRIKYVIWNWRIWTRSSGWRPYTGENGHTKHLHLSVQDHYDLFDSPALWELEFLEDDMPTAAEIVDELLARPIPRQGGATGSTNLAVSLAWLDANLGAIPARAAAEVLNRSVPRAGGATGTTNLAATLAWLDANLGALGAQIADADEDPQALADSLVKALGDRLAADVAARMTITART